MLRTFGTLAIGLAIVTSCTVTHPLDGYSAAYGRDGGPNTDSVSDAGLPFIPNEDSGLIEDAAVIDDAGCRGVPLILEPAPDATVDASMRLRVSAPSCIQVMKVYIDYKDTATFRGATIDQSFPIDIGAHKLGVNGWAGTDTAHVSQLITVTRKY
jgi:hypothetical protein